MGDQQGPSKSPLPFILGREKTTREHREEDIWKLLYTYGVVLSIESRESVEQKFLNSRQAMTGRRIEVDIGKTKDNDNRKENLSHQVRQISIHDPFLTEDLPQI